MLYLKNKILIASMILLATTVSCKDNSDSIPHVYELFLEFTDEQSANLLNTFNVNKFKTAIEVKTDEGDVLKANYSIIENSDKKILNIHSSTLPWSKVSSLTYSIQNEELMGSTEIYTLNTTWSFVNNSATVTTLSINGTPLSPTQEGNFRYYVITRPQ